MRQVATTADRTSLTDIAHRAIESASRIVFHETGHFARNRPTIGPRALATILTDELHSMWAARFLAVMALVDGVLEKEKLDLSLEYASVLDVHVCLLRGPASKKDSRRFSQGSKDNGPPKCPL